MSIHCGRVLLIDDSLVIQRLVAARLQCEGYEVHASGSGEEGLRLARELNPDVVLLDVQLPDVDGFEICKRFKSDSATQNIPILFLTGQAETRDKVRGLDLGAIDYVSKPFDPVELRARVRAAHRIKTLLDMLEREARMDGLTGLHNRRFFDQRLSEELDRCVRYGSPLALILIDVDRFKSINDSYGHAVGDRVLLNVASTLTSVARGCDLVARFGGEEFTVLLPEQSIEHGVFAAERLRRKLASMRIAHKDGDISLTASFGVSACIEKGADAMIQCADAALYAAKENGRNRVYLWGAAGPEPSPIAGASKPFDFKKAVESASK